MRYAKALMGSLLLASVQAHMIMIYPPAFGGPNNPYTKKDDDLTKPLTIDQFPCKGYQSAMKDPTGGGTPTACWKQGGSYNFSLSGSGGVDSDGASHGGGSCQVALSYDQGTSFTVIHSYMGGCGFKGSYKFTVPSDAPVSKAAMFAWTWMDVSAGLPEFYMNCAAVTIDAGTGSPPAIPFSQRPDFAVGNLGGTTCKTEPNFEPVYPNPGPDIDVTKNLTNPETNPGIKTGCPGVKGIGEHGGNSAGPAPAAGYSSPAGYSSAASKASLSIEATSSKASAYSPASTDLTYFQTGQQAQSQASSTSAVAIKSSSASSALVPATSGAELYKASSTSTLAPSSTTSSNPTTLATNYLTSTAPSAPGYHSGSGYVSTVISVYTTLRPVTSQANSACGGPPTEATAYAASSPVATVSSNQLDGYASPTSQAPNYPASTPVQSTDSPSTTPSTTSEQAYGSSAVSLAPAYTDSPVASAPATSDASLPVATGTPAPSTSASSSGAGGITTDGQCGAAAGGTTCKDSIVYGACCSQFGWCGVTMTEHCGTGCQDAFGVCGTAGSTHNPGVTARKNKRDAPVPAHKSITPDGSCGEKAGYTCLGSKFYGACCSKWSWCGQRDIDCQEGCQSEYGMCGPAGAEANVRFAQMSSGNKMRAKYWSA